MFSDRGEVGKVEGVKKGGCGGEGKWSTKNLNKIKKITPSISLCSFGFGGDLPFHRNIEISIYYYQYLSI